MLLGKLFEGLLKVAFLGAFNKIAGAVFGFTKYLIITGVFLYFFHKVDSKYTWILSPKLIIKLCDSRFFVVHLLS
ncbi:MAG: CvpA family protein [Dolichospermum sp.]